jgi:hypothetical protein
MTPKEFNTFLIETTGQGQDYYGIQYGGALVDSFIKDALKRAILEAMIKNTLRKARSVALSFEQEGGYL